MSAGKGNQKKTGLTLISALAGLMVLLPASAGEPLQGNVQETGAVSPAPDLQLAVPMSEPVVKKRKLRGQAEDTGAALSGQATDENPGMLKGEADQAPPSVLKGSAQTTQADLQAADPDTANQELMVEWDKWHNRLLWSIQSGVQELINSPENAEPHWDAARGRVVIGPNLPLGTKATFFVRVSSDRRIIKARIVQPSGIPEYDKALLDAIYALDGTAILRFPKNSMRERVNETATIITSDRGEREFFKFGDVEKYSVPGR